MRDAAGARKGQPDSTSNIQALLFGTHVGGPKPTPYHDECKHAAGTRQQLKLERQKQKEASSAERRHKRRPSGAWKLEQVLRNRLDGACNNGRAPAGRCVGQIIAPRL